jgi:DNA-binding NarL/FixJ family response regulator
MLREPVDCVAASRKIGIAIASDVRLVREGLAKSLRKRPCMNIVGVVDLQPEGRRLLARHQPEIVVVDVAGADIKTLAKDMREACAQAKLLAIALANVDADVLACAEAGFANYVPREGGASDLHQAILDTADGLIRCPPRIAAAMFARLADTTRRHPDATAKPSVLTAREGEILALAETGRSNKEIARRLAISDATVKNHMHNIIQKLGVSRRSEAAASLRATGDQLQPSARIS